ncbi:protein kinase domain-containing protein [Nannocystis pusilla]|uniref:protein kinase domain-containing protein n=1 Tax=Nannocystis pusilla TaxID=889268 RepID=UPI003B7E55A9
MTTCPSDETVAALVEGALAEDDRAALELHVAGCPTCAAIVAELARLVAPDEVATATTIGRYELAEPLGSGGMGLVLEAFDPLLARRVAVKIVRPDRPLARSRLLAEARALALLADPHVLTLHDVVDSERGVCLVTELVDGEPADVWCRRVRPTWSQIQALYLQVARGLGAVHARGLLHRDVKPANVFVGRDGRARLGDFGLVGDGAAALGGTPASWRPSRPRARRSTCAPISSGWRWR